MDQQVVHHLVFWIGTPLIGFGFPLAAHRYAPSSRIKQLNSALEHADLSLDADARSRLERQASRRSLWAALASGTAFTLAAPVLVALRDALGDGAPIVGVAAMFLGLSLGGALSALYPVDRSVDPVRVSALQPHGLRDYLRGYEIAAEAAYALLGIMAVVLGTVLLLRDDAAQDSRGWIAVVFGILAAGATVTAWLLEKKLLNAPAVAGNESELIANDVIVAMGLRDLLAAATTATTLGGYIAIIALNAPLWLIGLYLVAVVAMNWQFFNGRLAPDLAPVAHRLAAKPQAQAQAQAT